MKCKGSPNWIDYWHGDSLSPKKIANELGFDSSAFKNSRNPLLFKMLQELKLDLSVDGFYHKRKRSLALEIKEAVETKDSDEEVKDSAKVRDLKRTNRRLQNENAKLAAEIAKLSEFKDVLVEMGLWK
jgi:hypothetical protein